MGKPSGFPSYNPLRQMTYKEWMSKTAAKFQLTADEVDLILCNQSQLIPDPDANVDVRTAKKALCLNLRR